MDKTKQEKIKRFLDDRIMSDAVYGVLLDTFLSEKVEQDVNILAASRLAVTFLKEGWKELERFKQDETTEPPAKTPYV